MDVLRPHGLRHGFYQPFFSYLNMQADVSLRTIVTIVAESVSLTVSELALDSQHTPSVSQAASRHLPSVRLGASLRPVAERAALELVLRLRNGRADGSGGMAVVDAMFVEVLAAVVAELLTVETDEPAAVAPPRSAAAGWRAVDAVSAVSGDVPQPLASDHVERYIDTPTDEPIHPRGLIPKCEGAARHMAEAEPQADGSRGADGQTSTAQFVRLAGSLVHEAELPSTQPSQAFKDDVEM